MHAAGAKASRLQRLRVTALYARAKQELTLKYSPELVLGGKSGSATRQATVAEALDGLGCLWSGADLLKVRKTQMLSFWARTTPETMGNLRTVIVAAVAP